MNRRQTQVQRHVESAVTNGRGYLSNEENPVCSTIRRITGEADDSEMILRATLATMEYRTARTDKERGHYRECWMQLLLDSTQVSF
ncbi:hypothetical protein J4233_04055 [Candidatus Pacearchaeota archaeon]|nr:hypothetical protein [Candidatus Pacearchaeota archaeon]